MATQSIVNIRARAGKHGLYVTKYNPGDRPRYRIHDRKCEDYHDGGIATYLTLNEVAAFLDGYWQHKTQGDQVEI